MARIPAAFVPDHECSATRTRPVTTDNLRTLRADRQTIRSWLDRLDRRAAAPALDARAAPRFRYRGDDLTLQLQRGEEPGAAQTVVGRNLSRTGAGVLAGQFIYPNTACQLTLTSPYRRSECVPGRVVRCRYIVGSGSLYEVGVQFERPIDVAVFAPQAKRLRILLASESSAITALVQRFLTGLNTEVSTTTRGTGAIRALADSDLDLVLVDFDSEGYDAFDAIARMRASGFVGPIIGLAVRTGPGLDQRCQEAGCTGYITKPLVREDLRQLVAALLDPPLVSTVAADPALAPLVDRFVAGLRDRVTGLSLASETEDWEAVARIVRDLQAEAGSYGFAEISEEAAYVQAALEAERARLAQQCPGKQLDVSTATAQLGERVRPALRQLMHLCLKARATGNVEEGTPRPRSADVWMRLATYVPGAVPGADTGSAY